MSLINDALKKAQRQRTGESPHSQPPMPGTLIASTRHSRSGNSSSPQLLLVGGGALLGLAIAGGAFFFFRGESTIEPTPVAATSPSIAETAPAKVTADSPATTASRPPSAAPATSPASIPVVTSEPAPAPAPLTNLPSTDATAASVKTVAPPPSEPPAPSLRMIEAIEALRVAGIRVGAGSDAKVLMNDRVYRVGDTVDHALGIKLTGATASSLTFRDGSGASYTRNF